MEAQSRRRLKVQDDLGLSNRREEKQIDKAIVKEMNRKTKKERKRIEIEESFSYRLIEGISTAMDKYFLDAIIGLIPIVGDTITSVSSLPFIYVSLFKVRSIPLTLSVISNSLLDVLIGLIPFWIGNICDFFYRSNLKSFKQITGFVKDDRDVINEVNKRAVWMAVLIAIFCYLIYLVIVLLGKLWEWIENVFDWISTYLIGLFT